MVVSTIAVVMLHTNGVFWKFSRDDYWITSNIIQGLVCFGVPIFFMLSGITLMDYQDRYSTREYFARRLRKTLIPFLLWSVFGIGFNIWVMGVKYSKFTADFVIEGVLKTKFVNVFWFFIPLFIIYLCMPLFAAVTKEKRKSCFGYLLAVAFIFNIFYPFLDRIFAIKLYSGVITVDVIRGSFFYVIIGWYLANANIDNRLRWVIYSLGLVGVALNVFGTLELSLAAGKVVTKYKGYNNLPIVLYSVGVFVFLKTLWENYLYKHFFVVKTIEFLANYTFAIYLLHSFIMRGFVKVFDINIYSIWYRVLGPVPIIITSIAITWGLRKFYIGKWIVP